METSLDCCGLLHNSAPWFDVVTVENLNIKSVTYAYSQYGSSHVAASIGSALTIVDSKGVEDSEIYVKKFEIELDNDIELVCWGVDAKCLIVGDSCGTLHFVTVAGDLLFSHRVLSKNENSKFVYLGFKGEGQLQSLIAVFENRKVFGIAQFCVDKICHLALNEPSSLSGAIRKMKFLKCDLPGNLPIQRAEVYHTPSLSLEKHDHHEITFNSKDNKDISAATTFTTSLSIAMLDSGGDLYVGSIGSTDLLICRNLTHIIIKNEDHSIFLYRSPESQRDRILDVAIVNFPTSTATVGDDGARASNSESLLLAIALYSNNIIAVIDLRENTIIQTFPSNVNGASKICMISPVNLSPKSVGDKVDWSATIFGVQSVSTYGTRTNLFALLFKVKCTKEILMLRLGSADSFDETHQMKLDAGFTPTVTISPPSNLIFRFHTVGERCFLSGTKIPAALHFCVRSVVTGLVHSSENSECLYADDVEGKRGDGAEESRIHQLLGKLIQLSLTESMENNSGGNSIHNPFGVEELLDMALLRMTSLQTCGEVSTVVSALFLFVVDPPVGFLYRAIDVAERAMNSIVSTSMQFDFTHSSYLNSLIDLKRCLDTARHLSDRFPLGKLRSGLLTGPSSAPESEERQYSITSEEELLRQRTVVLAASSPCSVSSEHYISLAQVDIWMRCVAAGALWDASLIMSRHSITTLIGRTDKNNWAYSVSGNDDNGMCDQDYGGLMTRHRVLAALHSIPDSVPPSEIVAWVVTDIQPHIHNISKDLSGEKHSTQMLSSVASEISRELCRRARLSSEHLGHPFEAIPAVKLAVLLASSTVTSTSRDNSENDLPSNRIVKNDGSEELLQNLQIQAAIWRSWDDRNRPSLSDVTEAGLSGLVWERLWTLADTENVISEDINELIEPLVTEFGLVLDNVLDSWIQATIEQRVVFVGDHPPEGEEGDEMYCSLSRLVSVVAQIRNPQRRVGSLLSIFQVSFVDRGGDSSVKREHSSIAADESGSLNAVADGGGEDKGRSVVQDISMTHLCKLAQAACSLVEPAAAEALTEAIRSQRIKTLASSYGIISFDPRDGHQIKAAANVISMKTSPHALRDAIEFASSWGSDSANLSGLLTRAVVNRSMQPNGGIDSADDSAPMEKAIRAALSQVPTHMLLAVVEDSCTYLIESLQEICEDSLSEGIAVGCLASETLNAEAGILVRSVICIVSVSLDVSRDNEDVVTGTKNNADRNNTHSVTRSPYASSSTSSSSWVNSDLLSCFKRLKLLQSEEGVFLSLRGLRDVSVCKTIITRIAGKRADRILGNAAIGLKLKEVTGTAARISKAKSSTDSNSGRKDSDKYESGNEKEAEDIEMAFSALTPEIRRLCALLSISPFLFAHNVMKKLIAKEAPELAMDVAKSLESEDSSAGSSSSSYFTVDSNGITHISEGHVRGDDLSILLEAAVTICSTAAKQLQTIGTNKHGALTSMNAITRPFVVSRDLLRGVASRCSPEHLGRTLDILNGSELVLAVHDRVEGFFAYGHGEAVIKTDITQASRDNTGYEEFKVSDGFFVRDGILMAPGAVLGHVLRYSAAEIRRRMSGTVSLSGTGSASAAALDLEELVCVLQRSENHLLAVRVLLSSWHLSDIKAQLLRSSLLSLSRKVLSYREIDTSLAVACLVMLPYDAMVRELKAAVPSIQSDFSRLRTVASVGEGLARLWDQDALLVVFQGLQTNAKWWHILSLHGVKIDPRAFQSSDSKQRDLCVRAVVPELLEQSNMDLEQAIDYCRQFDIEPEYASLCYVEKIILQSPKGFLSANILNVNDMIWAHQVRKATINVNEKSTLTVLRSLLPRIHPLDYERIKFLSAWIVAALVEEVEIEQDNTQQRSSTREGANINPFESSLGEEEEEMVRNESCGNGIKKCSTKARSDSYSVKATEEAEACRRYADIATYLAGISFPLEATTNISTAIEKKMAATATAAAAAVVTSKYTMDASVSTSIIDGTSGNTSWESCYSGVSLGYQARLPFWTLLSDPWLVITPLLNESPEIAAKLLPVCRALNIDKDDFTVRRVKAAYHRIAGFAVLRNTDMATQETDSAYNLALQFLPTISCVVKRVQLWEWLYSQEREKKNDSTALKFLSAGLGDIIAFKKQLKASNVQIDENTELASTVAEILFLREKMTSQLEHLRCEGTLRTLDLSVSSLFTSTSSDDNFSAPSFSALLLPHVEEPSVLLKRALIIAAECSWDAQLWSLRNQGSEMLTSQEIPHRSIVPAVIMFLNKVGTAVIDIALHTQFTAESKIPGSDSSISLSGVSGVESLRHNMIGKMLADVDPLGPISKDGSSGANNGSSSVTQGGLWSHVEESSVRVGIAEMRRREDIYLGFCIAALVGCCEDHGSEISSTVPSNGHSNNPVTSLSSPNSTSTSITSSGVCKRASYIIQLQAVVLGKGTKSQRRLTTRSRLRAAFALQLILATGGDSSSDNTSSSADASSGSHSNINNSIDRPGDSDKLNSTKCNGFIKISAHISPEVPKLIPFLFCLAELQETRLSCSEEALLEALTWKRSESQATLQGSVGSHARTDARLLVRTWLHDEGYHREVVELGRDVLFSAGVTDSSAWEGLLRHMDQRKMTRTYVQTLVILMRLSPQSFWGILKGPLKSTVLTTLHTFGIELLERADQIGILMKNRGKDGNLTPGITSNDIGDFSSPSSARVVLLERCHSSSDWEESPEDLGLSFSQLAALRTAVASLCGVQGVFDLSMELVCLVSGSIGRIADVLHSVQGYNDSIMQNDRSRGRGVDSMVCYYAERCAIKLLLLCSSDIGSGSELLSSEKRNEVTSSALFSILQAGMYGTREVGLLEQNSKIKVEAHLFIWRIFQTFCTSFSAPSIHSCLEKVCSSDTMSVQVTTLKMLLSGAALHWHTGKESRNATLLLLSWCLAPAQTNTVRDISPLSSRISNTVNDIDVAVDSMCLSKQTSIRGAVSTLSKVEIRSLSLAAELLSSELSVKDRLILKRLF